MLSRYRATCVSWRSSSNDDDLRSHHQIPLCISGLCFSVITSLSLMLASCFVAHRGLIEEEGMRMGVCSLELRAQESHADPKQDILYHHRCLVQSRITQRQLVDK